MMVLTSLSGTVLLSYSGLCLLNNYGSMDAVAWTEQGALLLNWICGFVAAFGLVVQYFLDRRSRLRKLGDKKKSGTKLIWEAFSSSAWSPYERKAG